VSLAWLFPLLWIGILDYCEHSEREGDFSTKLIQVPSEPRLLPGWRSPYLIRGAHGCGLKWPVAGFCSSPSISQRGVGTAGTSAVRPLCGLCLQPAGRLAEKLPTRFGLRVAYSSSPSRIATGVSASALGKHPVHGRGGCHLSVAIAISLVTFTGGLLSVRTLVGERDVAAANLREEPATQNAALVLVLLAAIYVVPALIGVMDWNSVLAKLWAAALWVLYSRCLFACGRQGFLGIIRYGCCWWLAREPFSRISSHKEAMVAEKSGRNRVHRSRRQAYSGRRLIRSDTRLVDDRRREPCDSLCMFLTEQTAIAGTVQPVDVKVVADLHPTTAPSLIFLSSWSTACGETISLPTIPRSRSRPTLRNLHRERGDAEFVHALRRDHSFRASHMAGTMMLNKHYVQPFSPMNNLENSSRQTGTTSS